MEIVSDFDNRLLNRREIKVRFASDSNPGFGDSKKKISEEFKVLEDNVAVKHLRSNFGAQEFEAEVFIYDTKEDFERVEQKKRAEQVKK